MKLQVVLTIVFATCAMYVSGLAHGDTSAKNDYNWPSYRPQFPPADKTFSDLPPQELIPYVLGDKVIDPNDDNYNGPDGQRLACAWFIWKTRGQSEIREKLADEILLKLFCVKSRHDNSPLAHFLGCLEMPDHITALLVDSPGIDCCYGPNLVNGLAKCGSVEYAPALMNTIESESSMGCVHTALVKMTGRNIDPEPDIGNYSKQKEDWIAWWKKTYPDKKLQPPSNKYRELLSDERIQMLRKLRRLLWVLQDNFKHVSNQEQEKYPNFPIFLPAKLEELIGLEYRDSSKVTVKDLQSIRYLLPPDKEVGFDIGSHPLMVDESLRESHNLVAEIYYEGRIDLKPFFDVSESRPDNVMASGSASTGGGLLIHPWIEESGLMEVLVVSETEGEIETPAVRVEETSTF